MQPFSVGTCFSEALEALRRSWQALLVVLAISVPLISTSARVVRAPDSVDRHAWMLTLIPGFEVFISTIVTAAVLRAHYRDDVPLGRVLVAAVRRVLPVYFVFVLIALVVLAIGFACSLPYQSRETWTTGLPPGALAMFLVWMIVAAMLYTRWFVAIPAAVLETWNPMTALRRSDRLTRGHRGALFAIIALFGTLSVGTLAVIEVRLGDRPDIDAILFAVVMLGSIPFAVIRAALSATAYAQLRGATEAGDPARLGEVFA